METNQAVSEVRPDTGNPGGAKNAEAGMLRVNSNTLRSPTVIYQASEKSAPILAVLGTREYEMVRALRGGPLTRVELVRVRPRLGLNATGTVARLRRKGIPVASIWHKVKDTEGRTVRFVSYHLTGKVEVV